MQSSCFYLIMQNNVHTKKINSVNIVWFKRDLRISDHGPLLSAAEKGFVVPLYIVEPKLWQQPDSSRRHWCFIYDSILELQKKFLNLGVPLIIRVGEAIDVFQNLNEELGPFNLCSHEETGNDWTYQRDLNIGQWCKKNQIKWTEFQTNGIVRRLKNRDQWSTLREAWVESAVFPEPQNLQGIQKCKSDELPDKNNVLFKHQDIIKIQAGGRSWALKILESFLRERGKKYSRSISKPELSVNYCSRLSPHITFGTISIREIEKATRIKMQSLLKNTDIDSAFFCRNLASFLSRIAWHCHFIQKLEQQPNIEFKCMHRAFDGMREPEFRSDFFEAWKNGLTGYPLVDACMRSLKENGWINFRMRAMLVSFASYNLWLDWRQTAPYLAQLFTDYEPGIHYSQFQMQSGVTGINTVRIYNPVKQSYDQDPMGTFIRKYVPELKDVSNTFIHEPWKMFEPLKNYPKPIVDYATSMRYARNEISKRWKQDDFKAESKLINQKLGSRSKNRSVRKNKSQRNETQKSEDQFSFEF